jgi:HK97 gp10 family phage protein
MSDAVVTVRVNPAAKAQAQSAAEQATREVFLLDIKPAAVAASPVTPEGLQRNMALKRKRPGGTGTNRRSIDVDFERTAKGFVARLFTQSGYGGYLETGTSKMRAQPYLYPSFMTFKDKIAAVTRRILGSK